MPKKKIIPNNEPVSVRPQRNMKAKIVFDPSDNHIPKKRAKYSFKYDKPTETTKKTTIDRRRKQGITKTKSIPLNPVNKSFDCSSTEINNISPIHSPINSPVIIPTSEILQEISNNCFACSKHIQKEELVDCPICLIKAHRHCLIVNEPIWKFKLDLCPWLCKQCRKQYCSKCLKDELQSKVQRRCITCEVGLHTICYESYDIKPLHKIESELYVCIPCMTLATQKMPEEDDDDDDDDNNNIDDNNIDDNNINDNNIDDNNIENNIGEDVVESRTSSIMSVSSDEVDTDINSFQSYTSSEEAEEEEEEEEDHNIPNTLKWDKAQVFDYLKDHLSQEIVDQLIHFELDGRALHLLQRKDILKMGLKLGHALHFYKQVRILQSQSTYSRILWE